MYLYGFKINVSFLLLQHDRTDVCTPYTSSNDKDGNFIMFASATSGDRPNNRKFSDCSKDSIAAVSSSLNSVMEKKLTISNAKQK